MVLMVVVGARGCCCSPPVCTSSTSISINTRSTSKTLTLSTSHRERNLSTRELNPHWGRPSLPHVLVSTATQRHSRQCRWESKGNCVMNHSISFLWCIRLLCATLGNDNLAEGGEVARVIGVSDRFLTSWSRSSVLQALGPYWAKQETYTTPKIEARSRNHCCGKATSIKYVRNVCLLWTRSHGHTNCIFSAPYHVFPQYLINSTIFGQELLNINVCFELLYNFRPKHFSF
jgi:hypothetical protein